MVPEVSVPAPAPLLFECRRQNITAGRVYRSPHDGQERGAGIGGAPLKLSPNSPFSCELIDDVSSFLGFFLSTAPHGRDQSIQYWILFVGPLYTQMISRHQLTAGLSRTQHLY